MVACKGDSKLGPGSDPPPPPVPIETRQGLVYAYYGDDALIVDEVKDHATHVWAWGRGGWPEDALNRIRQAKAAGLGVVLYPEMLHLGAAHAEPHLRAFFQMADAEGLLPWIDVLYTGDEPDVNHRSAAFVVEVNAMVRRVAREFPALDGVQLAVIYGNNRTWPGIESFDWVGFDDYDRRGTVFTNGLYADLKSRLRGDQRIILVPGGADPWRQEPSEFERVAMEDKQVIAIVPFLWIENREWHDGAGIRSNPLRASYVLLGRRIKETQ